MANDKDAQTAARDTTGRGRTAADEAVKGSETTTRKAADAARDMMEGGERAGRDTAEIGNEAAKRAGETISQATRRGAETASESGRRAADAVGDTSRRAVEVGSDLTRRGAEAIRDTSREMSDTATRVAGRQAEQVQRLFGWTADGQGEALQQTQRNLEAIVRCGTTLMDGMQSIWREWLSLSRDAMQRQMDGVNTMLRSRTVQDVYVAQSDLIKDEIELVLHRGVKLSQMSAQAADAAARRLTERAEQAADENHRRV